MANKEFDPCEDAIRTAMAAGQVPNHPIADGRFVPNPVICTVLSAAKARGWKTEALHELCEDGALKLSDLMGFYQQIGYKLGRFEELFGDYYLAQETKAA